jgi:hypothetical protein
MVIKLPGVNLNQNKYGRCLHKLTSSTADLSNITKLSSETLEIAKITLENVENMIK